MLILLSQFKRRVFSLKKIMAITVGVAISFLGGLALGGVTGAAYAKPKKAYSVSDLNNDGLADFVYERGGAVRGMGAGGTVCGAFFLDYDDLLEAYERFGHDNDVKILDIKIREDSNHYTHQKLSNNL